MNHKPAPEITAVGWRSLLQRIRRLQHFLEWEYGMCRGDPARRNRRTGAVQFILRKKGTLAYGIPVEKGTLVPVIPTLPPDQEQQYIYIVDWWFDYGSSWWSQFKTSSSSAATAETQEIR